jgi:hypothetical protein
VPQYPVSLRIETVYLRVCSVCVVTGGSSGQSLKRPDLEGARKRHIRSCINHDSRVNLGLSSPHSPRVSGVWVSWYWLWVRYTSAGGGQCLNCTLTTHNLCEFPHGPCRALVFAISNPATRSTGPQETLRPPWPVSCSAASTITTGRPTPHLLINRSHFETQQLPLTPC